jgi:SNF2 family DNA or RNA helicase
MDGDTSELDREAMLNAFQPEADHKTKRKKPSDCRYTDPLIFLMTTYVGGVGLNLTNATRVIIMDPAKNPRFRSSENLYI